MNRVKTLIRNENFSGNVFPFSKGYAAWETDEVIFSKNTQPENPNPNPTPLKHY
jgi:hypothetical protein